MPDPSNKRDEILISMVVGAIAGTVIAIGTWPELIDMLSLLNEQLLRVFPGKGGTLEELLLTLYWMLLGAVLVSIGPSLLGAAVGAATGWLLVRCGPRPWVLFSAVVAASSLAVGVLVGWGWWWGFHVSEVSVRAEPSDYEGPCPVTLKFVASITVKGASGVVRYMLPRGERIKDKPYEVVDRSIHFESPGTKEVTSDVTLGKEGRIPGASGTLQIDILKPRIQRVKAAYRIKCISWSGPGR